MTTDFENENNSEFSEPETGAQEEGGQKKGVTGNLISAWRTRPLFKFIVLVIGIFAVGVAAVKFFGGGENAEVARLARPPALKEAPGAPASPYMRKQTEMASDERAREALRTGGSAIPTPLGQPADITDSNEGKEVDPLRELRAETELLKKRVQQTETVQKQITQRSEPFDGQLAEAMQRQMLQLMQSWAPQGIKTMTVLKVDETKNAQRQGSGRMPKIIVNAGTVSYAQLLTEANSDVPGPILAQIVSGPLNGARAIGTFQVANGYDEYLVLTFTLADKHGKDYQINAIALDPDTTLGGMATEVDERYFSRVILPAGAAFLQGLGQALSTGSSTVATNGTTTIVSQAGEGFHQGLYSGLSQSAQTMGQFLTQRASQIQPLVRIAAGTPIGMFFVSSVADPEDMQANGMESYGMGSTSGYGQQGQNYNVNYSSSGTNGGLPYSNSVTYGGSNSVAYGSNSVPYSNNYATMNNNGIRGNTTTVPTNFQQNYGQTSYGQQNYGR